MSNQLQVSLQRLHVSLNHFETHSKCFSSRIFELRSSSMQSYHRLVKRIPWRSRKQEQKFNAEFNKDNEVLSTIASEKMIGILQPPDNVIYYILGVDISVIKPWIKMTPVKWYDIISLSEMISYHFTGLNCPIKKIVIIWLDQSGCTLYFGF